MRGKISLSNLFYFSKAIEILLACIYGETEKQKIQLFLVSLTYLYNKKYMRENVYEYT